MTRHTLVALCILVVLFCVSATRFRLDTDFGNQGVQVIDWYGGRDAAYAIATSPDESKYYLAGPIAQPPGPESRGTDFGVACLDSHTGAVCSTFDKVAIDFENVNGSRTDVATTLVVQPSDGRIVVGGTSNLGAGTGSQANVTFALARLLPENGALDFAFGTDRYTHAFNGLGKVTTDVDVGRNDEIFAMLLTQDEKIFASGFANPTNTTGAGPAFNIGNALYHSDGTLDESFGGLLGSPKGRQITNIGPDYDDRSRSAVITTDEQYIYVIGRTRAPSNPQGVFVGTIVKYRRDGSVVTSYGNSGDYSSYINGSILNRGAISLQPANRQGSSLLHTAALLVNSKKPEKEDLIVAGTSEAWDNGLSGTTAIMVARRTPDGFPVSGWGYEPQQAMSLIKIPQTASNTAETILYSQREDRLYILSRLTYENSTVSGMAIVRLRANNGRLDTSFGNQGIMLIDLSHHGIVSGYFRSGKLVDNERVLIAVGEGSATLDAPANFVAAKFVI